MGRSVLDILFKPVTKILKVNEANAKALARLGIYNLRDLLFYKPNSFQIKELAPDLSNLQDGQLIQAEVIIQDVVLPSARRGPIKIMVGNETGSILLVFFHKIPPFIFNRLKIGSKHTISGKVQLFDYYFQISHPEFIFNKQLGVGLNPVYSLTYGLINKQLYSYIINGIEIIESSYAMEKDAAISNYLTSILTAIKTLHLYKSTLKPAQIEQAWNEAIKYLAMQELFANQALLVSIRRQKHIKNGRSFLPANALKESILRKLAFQLTPSQREVISEIEQDQTASVQMMRLLQGDVGSGKTLVALLTMLNTVVENSQSILMAPTDLLANQHYQFVAKALEDTSIKFALLTGKTSIKERRRIIAELENGEIQILLGTHALFQEKVNFKDLAYIIIDEQHKFGVEQRLKLINKASHPDVLVMTATPIPRSLTLTMFGDMAVSKLQGKPLNRLPIITTAVPATKIAEIITAISKKINLAEKIFWVCPLIAQSDQEQEENDDQAYTDVISRFSNLEKVYPSKVGMVHGKMPAEQKDIVMQKFKAGDIAIIVATTVIEVGIDVPAATLIIIENAENFGLAQLHQLRGRVGRSHLQSYCIMIYNNKRLSQTAKKRLEIMRSSNDGFYIAEQDLILRGSGEILGTKQSGEPEFFYADLARDIELLIKANKLAEDRAMSEFIDFQIRLFARNVSVHYFSETL